MVVSMEGLVKRGTVFIYRRDVPKRLRGIIAKREIKLSLDTSAGTVVGVDFDYEVLGEKNGMMMVAVSGTAVKMA